MVDKRWNKAYCKGSFVSYHLKNPGVAFWGEAHQEGRFCWYIFFKTFLATAVLLDVPLRSLMLAVPNLSCCLKYQRLDLDKDALRATSVYEMYAQISQTLIRCSVWCRNPTMQYKAAKACAVALVARFAADAFVPMGLGPNSQPSVLHWELFDVLSFKSVTGSSILMILLQSGNSEDFTKKSRLCSSPLWPKMDIWWYSTYIIIVIIYVPSWFYHNSSHLCCGL